MSNAQISLRDQVTIHETPLRGSRWRGLWQVLRKHKDLTLGAVLLLVIVLAALSAIPVSDQDLRKVAIADRLQPPFWFPGGHPGSLLGTDQLGRDIFMRLLYGARISLTVGIAATSASTAIGVVIGLISGYYGGAIDAILMRITDVFLSFPGIILAIIAVSLFGSGLQSLILVLAITAWEIYARTVRSTVLFLKQQDFILAARAVGVHDRRVLFRHLLPNCLTPIVVIASLQVASMILAEAALSFLGLGIQPPTPSWGTMINDGRQYLDTAWWISIFPGLAIVLTVLGVKFLSDGLSDILDPRGRKT